MPLRSLEGRTRRHGGTWVALVLLLACQSAPQAADPAWLPGASEPTPVPERAFSGERVLEQAGRLARRAERAPGSEDAERVREEIRETLESFGARTEVLALSPIAASRPDADAGATSVAVWHTLIGRLPGRSADVMMLAARYDTGGSDDDDASHALAAASGAAVVLELGRVLATRPRPYTVWLVFIEGDGAAAIPDDGTPDEAIDRAALSAFPGSTAFVRALEQRDGLESLRLAIFFESLVEPDMTVVRDLHSHRVHREAFWESAFALGLQEVFVLDAPLGSPETGHRALLEREMRRVVAIVGTEADSSDGEPARDDAASEAAIAIRLDELGAVVLDALDRITARLDRIDEFATPPVAPAAERPAAAPPATQ